MYTTEHLDIYVAPSVYMCAGTAEDLERHAAAVAAAIEVEFDRRVPVYYGTNGDCDPFPGCTKPDGAVFAGVKPGLLEHELGHAVACEVSNDAAPFLTEGCEELTWEDNEVHFTGELDCNEKHTRGPDSREYSPFDQMYRSFIMHVPQAGVYSVDVEGGTVTWFRRCGTMAIEAVLSDYLVEGAIDIEIEAGDWRVDIYARLGPTEPIAFHMWPAEG